MGIQIIDRFDPTEFKAKVAAQVNDFNPKDYMDPKSAKRMDKFCQYAVAAAKEAVEDANLCMENEESVSGRCFHRFRSRKSGTGRSECIKLKKKDRAE